MVPIIKTLYLFISLERRSKRTRISARLIPMDNKMNKVVFVVKKSYKDGIGENINWFISHSMILK